MSKAGQRDAGFACQEHVDEVQAVKFILICQCQQTVTLSQLQNLLTNKMPVWKQHS